MNLLVGNTGLIGKTLKDKIEFDYEFNSKNINELSNLDIDPLVTDLYLCCLPATKWLINKDPQTDLNNIFNILNVITKKEYNNVILYSTIDVYNNVPLESDESYPLQITSPDYGSNRLLFEKLVSNTLKYKKLLTLRLPALFGNHIKKNILFDLLNNNQIDKINYNSKYQWYNLDNLVTDTSNCLDIIVKDKLTINLFSEPVNTSEILELFNINKSKVDSKSSKIVYNYKTNSNSTEYVKNKKEILHEIKEFIFNYKLASTKIAICLFGEPRDVLNRIKDWKNFSSHLNVDFYLAFYSNEDIYNTIQTLKSQLNVKSFFVTDNNLKHFDQLKYKADHPIYIYAVDHKATFSRITSQAFIRQKAISLVNLDEYEVVLLCRSDVSNFYISYSDIINAKQDPNLLIVNSGTHVHPGGGSGCIECTIESKCNKEYHANDVCDLWCMGSSKIMDKWNSFYNNLLEDYKNIQKQSKNLDEIPHISYKKNLEENEIMIMVPSSHFNIIENDVHCYYPEKIMRLTFKNTKIIGATHNKKLWEDQN
jgi:hypothetical protein